MRINCLSTKDEMSSILQHHYLHTYEITTDMDDSPNNNNGTN